MTDAELIEFMWNIIYGLVTGDELTPEESDILVTELTKKGILDGDFPC